MKRDMLPVLTIAGWQCLFDEAKEFDATVMATRIQNIVDESNLQGVKLSYEKALDSYSKAAESFEQNYLAKQPITNSQRVEKILQHCGLSSSDSYVSRLLSDLQMSHSSVGMSIEHFAKEFLEFSKKHYRTVLLCDTWMSNGASIDHFLHQNGLIQYFDHRLYSDQTGCHKIDGSAFEYASKLLNTDISTFSHIGDFWESDVIAAAEAGVGRIVFIKKRNHPLHFVDHGSREVPETLLICDGLEEALSKF